jgi:hypothetical protein
VDQNEDEALAQDISRPVLDLWSEEKLNEPVVITREHRPDLDELFEESLELDERNACLSEWQTLMLKAYKLGRQHGA